MAFVRSCGSLGLAALLLFVSGAAAQSGSGKATTYWDCCKTTCGWRGNCGPVNNPVRTCNADGVTSANENAQGGCASNVARNAGSYVCNDQAPFAKDGKQYAFAAANVGLDQKLVCCACYELKFSNPSLRNKLLTVQLINTGSDLLSGQFDIQVPGGGFGIFTQGCPKQWQGNYNWGNQYGGVTSRAGCSSIPRSLTQGCYFKFDWFKSPEEPRHTYKRIKCPAALTDISKCKRTDDPA